MTPEIILTLSIVAAAVILFATEKLRVDLIALLVLLTLTFTGLTTPVEAFSGFSSPAVITVWAVYIVSGGLFRSGAADVLGARIMSMAGNSEPRLILVIMLASGILSAFMNNIGAAAVLLPAVAGVSRQSGVPLSRLLIPLSFASLMGGNMTLIGTPPNVLAASILSERGLATLGFFDFLPMGIVVFASGILYMVLAGRFLLPEHPPIETAQLNSLREYVSEVRVTASSPLAGKSLYQSRLGAEYDLSVVKILRKENTSVMPLPTINIRADDLLIVEGTVDNLLRAKQDLKLEIEAERTLGFSQIEGEELQIVEATLAPRAAIRGKTLRDIRFRDRYHFTALAIWRQGEVITHRLKDIRLRFGDTLLLQGAPRDLPALQEGGEFLVLEPVKIEQRRWKKAPLTIGILLLVLGLTTIGGFHVSLAMVLGSVLMVLTGCLDMDEAYQSIEWRSVFLIAGMLPLGLAMESSGTARFLADTLVSLLGGFGIMGVLAGIYILAGLITEPMSNAAATVLIVPIGIDIALELGADPRTFVLACVIGASTSFLTPVGHQANVLVFGPGGYKFTDFTRVGAPLNVVILIATLIFLPIFWPPF